MNNVAVALRLGDLPLLGWREIGKGRHPVAA
jgi:hypothetical protein